MWSPFLDPFVQAIARTKCALFAYHAERVERRQSDFLLDVVRRSTDTDFGRDHRFSEIRSVADFRKRVPIRDYDYAEPYVRSVMAGKVNALFGPSDRLRMFAITSGTTRRAKYIPVTDRFIRLFRHGWWTWGKCVFDDRLCAFRDMMLQITGAAHEDCTETGVPCGSVSGLCTDMLPSFVRKMYVRPPRASLIVDGDTKYYVTMRFAVTKRVSMISTANPSTVLAIGRVGERRHEELIRDVRDGTVTFFQDPDPEVARALRSAVTPDPQAARSLEEIRRRTGQLLPRDVWPGLGMIACWKGGTLGNYLSHFDDYFGDVPVHDVGLIASEGRMSIPMSLNESGGAADILSQFIEFVPEDQAGKEDPPARMAHEVEEGRNYFIVLTNGAGLYRYNINDLVKVIGFYRRTPIIEFLNKGSGFSNITGEKISEQQVVSAVRRAGQDGGVLDTFTFVPHWDTTPYYDIAVEEGALGETCAGTFAERVDAALRSLNVEYDAKRKSGRLGSPRVVALPEGTWNRYRDGKVRRNRGRIEQYKHVYLVNDFEFVSKLSETTEGPLDPAGAPEIRS